MPRKDPVTALAASFGIALRERREALGLSQEKLGFRVDLDRTYVSGVERGVRNPTLAVMMRLAKGLKTPLSTLVRSAERKVGRR